MENLVNAANSFMQQQGQQGGQGNSNNNNNSSSSQGGGSGAGGFNLGSLVNAASNHQSGSNTDANQFSSIASSLLSNHDQITSSDHPTPDELKNAHKEVQGNNSVNANQIGASAAIKAVQSVLGGQSGGGNQQGQQQGQEGGGDMQSKLMGVAMAHASDIFESKQAQGLIDQASKNQAVQQAGQYVMKMVMKQKLQSEGGGLGQLAGQFLN